MLNANIITFSACFYDSFRNSKHFRNCGSKYNEFIWNLKKIDLTAFFKIFELMKKLSIEPKSEIGGEFLNTKY